MLRDCLIKSTSYKARVNFQCTTPVYQRSQKLGSKGRCLPSVHRPYKRVRAHRLRHSRHCIPGVDLVNAAIDLTTGM